MLRYTIRLLRPIWYHGIVGIKSNGDLASNGEYFQVTLRKLENLQRFMDSHKTTPQQQYDSTTHRHEMQSTHTLLESHTVFIGRAVALLRLLSLMSDSVVRALSSDKDLYKDLRQLDFASLCSSTAHNEFLRKFLVSIMRGQDVKTQHMEHYIAEHLFTLEENRTHQGMRVLEHALNEKNQNRKTDLVKRGFKALEADISRVDLAQVLPLFIKNSFAGAAFKMCQLKGYHASEHNTKTECYNLCIEIVEGVIFTLFKKTCKHDTAKML